MTPFRVRSLLVAAALLATLAACGRRAEPVIAQETAPLFNNGGFEAGSLSSWTVTRYWNNGINYPPQSYADLNLQSCVGITPGSNGSNKDCTDRTSVKTNAVPESQPMAGLPSSLASPRWPKFGTATAVVNEQGMHQNVNSLKQAYTTTAADVDPADGKIHARFALSPQLQNAGHPDDQQPYFYAVLRNLTKGTVLYSTFNFSTDPSVPWRQQGTGPTSVMYTDWQVFDIAPGNAALWIGDTIEIEVVAAGCQPNGHWGQVYVDGFGARLPSLSISKSAPQWVKPDADLTYTFQVENATSFVARNAVASEVLPAGTTFKSIATLPSSGVTCTTPAAGSVGTGQTGGPTVTCALGWMNPASSQTFQVTVHTDPALTTTAVISNGNYSVQGDGINPILGPKVETHVGNGPYADLAVAVSDGVPAVVWGAPVSYTITATNTGPTADPAAVVTVAFPAQLTGVTWTCAGAGGASCGTPSGSGDITAAKGIVSLPVNGTATFFVSASVVSGSGNGTVAVTAHVKTGPTVNDSNPANNDDTDLDSIGTLRALTVTKDPSETGQGQVVSSPLGLSCGNGCASQAQQFLDGSQVTLTAIARPGDTFTGWTGGCTGTGNLCTVMLSGADVSVAAHFRGPVVTGSVLGGHGTVTCPVSPVVQQTSVSCAVSPDPGYVTSALTDNGTSALGALTAGTYTLSGPALVNDHAVVATFIKAKGTACGAGAECSTGLCVDGVCCDGACAGQCQACNVAGKAGTCSPVSAGSAPVGGRAACASDGSLCGGTCDGINGNACAYPVAGASCGASTCSGGVAGGQICDGAGTCTSGTQGCGAYVCGPTGCLGSCTFDGQCSAGSFCDSGACVPQRSSGQACTAADQCQSGFCADGVCCDARCDGQCEACALPGKKGTCSPAPAGAAPEGGRAACASDGSACGGACDGTRRTECVYPADGVGCRPPSCSAGTATLSAVCDGQGSCPPVQTQACTPLVCGPTACTGTGGCTTDPDCGATAWCSAGVCIPRLGPGVACGGDAQCASGHCVDGVCCDTACHGQCEACDVPGRAGTCSPVTGAPEGGRPACDSDGSACGGACDGTRRTSCAYPLDTVSCRAASCTGGVATLAAGCDGAGHCPAPQTQPCAPYLCDSGGTACAGTCTVNADCPAGTFCAGGVCAPTLAAGARCAASGQCASGYCVDGVCCDVACSGQCEACNVPGSVGTCTPTSGAPAGARPACVDDGSPCGGLCDGSHRTACTYPAGPVQCRAPSCAGGVATLATTCDGSGVCPGAQHQTCAPYTCAGTACAGTCTVDGDCAGSAYWCSAGVCVSKLAAGQACARAGQCGSGACVDRVCCDRACNGTCEACDVPGHVGACTPASGAPHGARPQCATDGSACGGFCNGVDANTCSYPGAETTCRAQSCSAGASTPPATCGGSGLCPAATQVACQSGACDGAVCVASDWKLVGGGCSSAGTPTLAPLGLLAVLLAPLRRRRRGAAALLVLVLVLLSPAAGRAETSSVDAQRFDPQGGAYDLLAVPSARVADHLTVSGGFLADYAAQPVRLVSASAGRSVELVKGMTSGSLTASLGLLGWAELSLTLPMALSGSGQPASAADPRLASETPAAGFGDLRVTPRISLVTPEAGIRVALLAPVSFPTGSATYQSAGTIVAVPTAALELGAPGGWRLLADAGVRLRQDQSFAGVDLGTAFVYGVAGEVPLLGGRVAALATVTGAVGSSSDQPLEALAAVRVRGPAGLEFTLGGGPGLSHAYGTPQYRVVAGLQFARRGPPREPEVATVSSGPQASPSAPAPKPATASATTAQKATAGTTAAPVAKGAAAGAARPSSTGTKTAFVTRAPEPLPRATLAKDRIVLRETVQFVEGRDDLAETSAPAIDEVATLLRSHPEIALLRIEVHTDDDGAPDDLLALSRRRANAIRSRLVRAGVAAGRLEARGYGDTRPLTTNYSARDRAINRRVELVVARTVPAPR